MWWMVDGYLIHELHSRCGKAVLSDALLKLKVAPPLLNPPLDTDSHRLATTKPQKQKQRQRQLIHTVSRNPSLSAELAVVVPIRTQ